MSFVRNLLADLVAKRLWPVALVLAAALVAVPVLLTQGVDPGDVPVAPLANADAPAPSVVTPASDAPRRGANPVGRNPFDQKNVGGPTEVTGGTGGTEGSSGDSGDGTGGGGSVGPGADVTGGLPALEDVDVIPVGGTDSEPLPKPDRRESYHVDLRFGRDGKLSSRRDVARLSPLPSADDPFFVFMGVLADGKTALFLVSSDAEATGDGTCKPSPANCERVEMQAGETEFFDVTTPEGEVVQYQLDLIRVARRRATDAAVAADNRTRESSQGREVLRHAIDTKQVDVAGIAYSRDLGVLVPSAAPAASGSQSTVFGGFRTDLRFGTPGALVNRFNLARLTPLPSTESPSFLFLGVMGDTAEDAKALFLNPSLAAVSGDAVCNPDPENCSRVELRAGERGLFDVPTIDGETDEYELEVAAITELQVPSEQEARELRDRESPAGRVILRRLIGEVGGLVADLNYSSPEGRLVEADPAG